MSTRFVDQVGMGTLERGRGRYQQKDYAGALVAFKETVEMSTGNLLLTALDHRAAAYEKLDKLQSALRDSKQMIDLKPDLAKGYMRCAKILQLKGENDLALKIYERGLKKVKIGTDTERTRLQSLYNRLRQAQDPGKSLDPLEFLPLELAQMVIENMGMRDRVVCLAVNKAWKRSLSSSYKLWTTFDTRLTRKPVSLASLKAHLRRSNYTLDKAIISMKAKFDVTRMQYLARTCKKLKSLEICGNGVVGDSLTSALPFAKGLEILLVGANCEIRLRSVQLALCACQKSLLDATFLRVAGNKYAITPGGWPEMLSLKTLNLRSTGGSRLGEVELRSKIPHVESLTFRDWAFGMPNVPLDLQPLQDLTSLEISYAELRVMPKLPIGLKHLTLRKMVSLGANEIGDEVFELPFLEQFDCSGTAISANLVRAITLKSIKAGLLKVLRMGGRLMEFAPGVPVEDEFPTSNSVEELSLASLLIREKRILEIVNLYPNLQRLDVSNTKVTGVAVKHLVSIGIKWIQLDECIDVSPDAVDYARSRDVEVVFNFPSRSGRATSFRDTSYAGVF